MCSFLFKFLILITLLLTSCGGGGSSAGDPTDKTPSPASYTDTDGDGTHDEADEDDDNDTVPDSADAFPKNPNESADLDGDGVGDNADGDDDNDGVADDRDPNPRALIKKVKVTAEIYTEDPETIKGPVKVLFAIDCSLAMLKADPIEENYPFGRRIAAMQEFIGQYNTEKYPEFSFGIVLWSSDTLDTTLNGDGEPGFTRSTGELDRVIGRVGSHGQRDYLNAMRSIWSMVEQDMIVTSYKDSGPAELFRTTYVVCFFSGGPPNAEAGAQTSEEVWRAVEQMNEWIDKGFTVRAFNFHPLFLSSSYRDANGQHLTQPPKLVENRQNAENTLEGMARRGNGEYQDFTLTNPTEFINTLNLGASDKFKIKYIVAYNHMVRPHGTLDALSPDSDGDGLTDQEEIDRGTNPKDRDTDNDGLSDFTEISIQKVDAHTGQPWPDPLVNDSNCPPPQDGAWIDQDSDGLTDCEERVVATWDIGADYDADGIPDGIEMLSGTDPVENLPTLDSDKDMKMDVFEVMDHTNVLVDDPILRERHAYSYSLTDQGAPDPAIHPDLSQDIRRYTMDISNIGLMDTQGAVISINGKAMKAGDNVIRLYIAQVPEARPDDMPIFSMAEATVNYHNAHNDHSDHNERHEIVFKPADFKMLPRN